MEIKHGDDIFLPDEWGAHPPKRRAESDSFQSLLHSEPRG